MTTLTRNDTQASLTLPDDYQWIDRYDWSPVVQAVGMTAHPDTGAGVPVIEHWTRAAGREITLVADTDRAWCSGAQLDTLRAWADIAGLELTLAFGGANYAVVFHHAAGAIVARPVVFFSDLGASEPIWLVTLRFLTIA